MSPDDEQSDPDDEFLLGKDYVPPTGLRKWMQLRIGDWPVYSLLLGLGQIIAANSYQITLLTGEVGQTATKLYGIATTYLITSIMWWFVFRYFKSIVCLSVPWFLYGGAFLLIGFAHFVDNEFSRGWVQNVGSGLYAAASSSGSIFFALNFGDESGAPVKEWVFRACVIQGTQQAYVIALWYWGSTLTKASSAGLLSDDNNIANTWKMTAICVPIAVFLWAVGLLMFFGLPNYYRQSPGKVPSFYRSVFRRKIVLWNFAVVIIQNFFLSAPYGRNWNCKSPYFNCQVDDTNPLQSSGIQRTRRPGKSSFFASSSSVSSGPASSSSSATSPNNTAGSSPCSPAVSGPLAGPRSGGASLASATTSPGSQAGSRAAPWHPAASGCGWAFWTQSRVWDSV
jgi:hypothetical protein